MYDTAEVYKLIDELAPALGVDPRTAKIIIGAEQVHKGDGGVGFKMPAQFSPRPSPVGAQGVGQVMPKTLQALQQQGHLPKDFVNDGSLRSQVVASLAAVKEIAPRAGNDPLRLAAYYNGGTNPGKAYGTPAFATAPEETRNHVEKARFVMNTLDGNQSPAETQRLNATKPAGAPSSIPDLGELMKLYGNVSQGTDTAVAAVRGYQQASDTGLQEHTEALQLGAEAAKAKANAAIEGNAILQARKDLVTQMFGLGNSDINTLRDEYVGKESQRRQLETQVQEQLSVGFFDNPLKYLANLTTLPGLVAQHNALAKRTDDINGEIATRQDLSIKQQQATAADLTGAYAKEQQAIADAEVARVTAEAAKLKVETAATNAKNMLTIVSADSGRLSAAAQLAAIVRAEQRQTAEELKLSKKETDELVEVGVVNKMLAPLGAELPAKFWKEMSPNQKLQFTQMGSRASYGNTLAESYQNIQSLGMYNRQKADPSIVRFMDSVAEQLPARIGKVMAQNVVKPPKPEDAERMALQELETEWKSWIKAGEDRERAPLGSPYNLDYNYAHITGKYNGSFIGNALTKQAQADLRNGAGLMDFNGLAAEALIEIKSEKLLPHEAAKQLATFYRDEQSQMYRARGLSLFNMPAPKDYTVYAGPAARQIDATNPAQLELYLMLRAKAIKEGTDAMQQMFAPYGNGPAIIDGPRGPIAAPVRRN